MKEKYFIYTTQRRFIKDIINSWLNRETSAVFYNNFNKNWNLLFTFTVSIYHWISLEVQDRILSSSIKSFSSFYINKLDLLPSVILFKDSILDLEDLPNSVYQSYDLEMLTFPYYKVKDIWWLKKIYKVFDVSMDDVVYAERNIWDLKEWEDRFFLKNSGNTWNLFKYKIIDKNQIYCFCTNLAKRSLELQ